MGKTINPISFLDLMLPDVNGKDLGKKSGSFNGANHYGHCNDHEIDRLIGLELGAMTMFASHLVPKKLLQESRQYLEDQKEI